LTKTSWRKRGLNYVTVAMIDLRESHFVATDLAFSVGLGGHNKNRVPTVTGEVIALGESRVQRARDGSMSE